MPRPILPFYSNPYQLSSLEEFGLGDIDEPQKLCTAPLLDTTHDPHSDVWRAKTWWLNVTWVGVSDIPKLEGGEHGCGRVSGVSTKYLSLPPLWQQMAAMGYGDHPARAL